MKIKHQFTILIAATVIIPIVSLSALPVYNHYKSPRRFLMQGFEASKGLAELGFSDNIWNKLEEYIKFTPPNVEMLAYYKDNILVSNFKEFPATTKFDITELYKQINNPESNYRYQFNFIPIEERKFGEPIIPFKCIDKVLIITRVDGTVTPFKGDYYLKMLFTMSLIIELFSLSLLIFTGKNIFNSITVIENYTKKIAEGDLDVKIEQNPRNNTNEITTLIENLEVMRLSLKTSQEKRTKFIMGVSHDLRTPVTIIKGYCEAISDGVVSDVNQIKNSVSIIQSKAHVLEELINDLINYVKLSSTDWISSLQPMKIKPILEDHAKALQLMTEIYNRKISTTVDIEDDLLVPVDKNLLNRTLENLITNAFRYTSDGDTISFSAVQVRDKLFIYIADTGCGIKAENLNNIFDLFYRESNSRREPGFGIGLSVVKTVIDCMGWNINVESDEEKGTCFTITIPLKN